MLFKSASIRNNTLFDSINVKGMDLEFHQPIIIILGDNGCGKSSLLQTLTTFTQDKDHYTNKGKAHFVIQHNGDEFELGADYGKKGIHYFIKDYANLNDSGNVGINNNLVNVHFNHNQDLDKLLRIGFRLSRMQKRDRKDFLMKFNPYNLDIIYGLQKKISTALRAIKSNVKHLTQRKAVLIDKSIPDEELVKLRKRVDEHKEAHRIFDKDSSILEVRVKELTDELDQLFSVDKNLATYDLASFRSMMFKERDLMIDIWREHSDLIMDKEIIDLNQLEVEIKQVEDGLLDKIGKLNQYKQYVDIDLDKEVTPRKERLKVIEKLFLENPIEPVIMALSKEQLIDVLQVQFPRLLSDAQEIIRTSCKVIHPTLIGKIAKKYDILEMRYRSITGTTSGYKEEIARLGLNIHNVESGSYPKGCLFSSCNLRKNVDQNLLTWKDKKSQLEKLVTEMTGKALRYQNAGLKLKVLLDGYEQYKDHLESFKVFGMLYKDLFEFILNGQKLFDLFNYNNTFLAIRVNHFAEKLQTRLLHIELENERKNLLYELGKLEDPNIPVKAIIVSMVKDLENAIAKDEQHHQALENRLLHTLTKYEINAEYDKHKVKVRLIHDQYIGWFKYTCVKYELDLFTFLLSLAKKEMARIQSILIELELLLKTQDNIRVILNTEILPVLEDLISKEKEYSLLENALGPDGLPKKYLISYLNTIIENANVILAQAWSYELQLEPLKMEDVIDFSFARVVNGIYADDIAKCSESQKDIIDIAWCLSMIITLGYGQEFPVYFDECDRHFDEGHRSRLVSLISSQITLGNLRQIFLVNHHAALSGALSQSQTICLSANNISVPTSYNEHVTLHYK